METRKWMLGEEHPDSLTSMSNLVVMYWNQGWLKEAEDLVELVMETRKRVLGEEHPHTITSMGDLAVTYSRQGRLKEAEELEKLVMETKKRVLGEEHPDSLTRMDHLAVTYLEQGRWKDAVKLEVPVIKARMWHLARSSGHAYEHGQPSCAWHRHTRLLELCMSIQTVTIHIYSCTFSLLE